VRIEMFRTLNPGELKRAFAKVFVEDHEYWLFMPRASQTYCDIAWCLKYDTGKWTRHSFADFLTMHGNFLASSALTIGELSGTIGEQNWRIGDRSTLASAPTAVFGDKDGYIYEYNHLSNNDNDTAVDGWFSTKDFNPTRFESRFRINRIDTYYTGAGLDVSYSTDKGVTWVTIGSLSASSNMETPQRLFLKLDAPLCRLRWRNNSSGQHFEFSRANIYWEPSGRRL
jgi:hypothetical protein